MLWIRLFAESDVLSVLPPDAVRPDVINYMFFDFSEQLVS